MRFFRLSGAFFLIIISISCKMEDSADKSVSTKSPKGEIPAVSVWDRISTRSKPDRDSKRTTVLSLGEQFVYLDSFAIDSTNKNTKFLKARLSDSSIVWVYDFATVVNAKPAAITTEVPLYIRPDLLTITGIKMNPMDIVAVTDEWDDWMRIVNEKKEHSGWIKKDHITTNPVDLAFALLAKRKLEEADQSLKVESIEQLIDDNPYPNSMFISYVQELLTRAREEYRQQEEEHRRRERDD